MHPSVKIGQELPLPAKRCPTHQVRFIENCPICHPPAKVVCDGCGEVLGVPCTNERGDAEQDPHRFCQEVTDHQWLNKAPSEY